MTKIDPSCFTEKAVQERYEQYALDSNERWRERFSGIRTAGIDLLKREAAKWLRKDRGDERALETLGGTSFLYYCNLLGRAEIDPKLIATAKVLRKEEVKQRATELEEAERRLERAREKLVELGGRDREVDKLNEKLSVMKDRSKVKVRYIAALKKEKAEEAKRHRDNQNRDIVVKRCTQQITYVQGLLTGIWLSVVGIGIGWAAWLRFQPWQSVQVSAEVVLMTAIYFSVAGGVLLFVVSLYAETHFDRKMHAELRDLGLTRWSESR